MIRAMTAACAAVLLALTLLGAAAAAATAAPASGLVRPVGGGRITQGFGCTSFAFEPVDRACAGGHWHSGVDLAAALGTPVVATAAGRVTVLVTPWGYGLHVIIDHGDGLTSLYGHLAAVTVRTGDVVDGGDPIGAMGSSGNSTGPHLHFEIRRDGTAENPLDDIDLP